MKKTAIRILALTLAALLMVTAFAGCAKKEKAPEMKKVQYVYRATELAGMPEDLRSIDQIFAVDGNIYLYGRYYDENWTVNGPRLYRCKTDGSEMTRVDLGIEDTVQSEMDEEESDSGENSNITTLTAAPDGGIWYVVQRSTYGFEGDEYKYKEHSTLRKIDTAGKTAVELDLDEFKSDEYDYFYVGSLTTDADGYLYMNAGQNILILTPAGEKYALIEVPEESSVNTMVRSGEGKVITSFYDVTGTGLLREIDRDAKGFGAEIRLGQSEDGKIRNNYYTIMPGYGCSVFYRDNQNVYAYDFASGTETTVLNYINSDLNANETGNLTPISETEMITSVYNWDDKTGEESITVELLTKVPDEEIQPKRIITLGTTGLDYNTRKMIVDFNKSSDTYRIELRDYSDQNGVITYGGGMAATMAAGMPGDVEYDWEAGMRKFNTDIISGNIPDIIQIDSNMPYDSYVSKGLLADLYPLIEKDEEIKKEDYLPNVFRALEKDGKLYSLIPGFTVMTVIGKTSVVGDRQSWTMDEMAQMMKDLPEGVQLFSEMTREQFMNYAMTLSSGSFINYASGECRFDSEPFKRLLEMAKTFPEEINWDELYGEDYDWTQYETQYRDNRTLLAAQYMSDFSTLHYAEAVNFGERVSFIGFPDDSGIGATLNVSQQFAIYAKSPNTEGAWAFLRQFMTDEFQEQQYNYPIKLTALEKKQQEAQKPYTYKDEDGNEVEMPNTYYLHDEEIDIGYPTQEEADRIMAYISTVTNIYRTDSALMDIVNEEAGGFFAGQRSVDDVAGVIQNRVKTYLAEAAAVGMDCGRFSPFFLKPLAFTTPIGYNGRRKQPPVSRKGLRGVSKAAFFAA